MMSASAPSWEAGHAANNRMHELIRRIDLERMDVSGVKSRVIGASRCHHNKNIYKIKARREIWCEEGGT